MALDISGRPFLAWDVPVPSEMIGTFDSGLAEDFVQMEGLGLYEVIEEDVALCEFACPSKVQLQKLIRRGLDLIAAEG